MQYIEEMMAPYDEGLEVETHITHTREELEKAYLEFKNKNPDQGYDTMKLWCEEYKGYDLDENGNAVSNYNMKSIWDWYVIGGRWDGILTENRQYSQSGFNFGDNHHTIDNNCISVEDFLNKYNNNKKQNTYGVMIDGNGVLHEGEKYGWFGTSKETMEKEDWNVRYERVLNNFKDDYIINLDCHI
jgi:hypothetical protein